MSSAVSDQRQGSSRCAISAPAPAPAAASGAAVGESDYWSLRFAPAARPDAVDAAVEAAAATTSFSFRSNESFNIWVTWKSERLPNKLTERVNLNSTHTKE